MQKIKKFAARLNEQLTYLALFKKKTKGRVSI